MKFYHFPRYCFPDTRIGQPVAAGTKCIWQCPGQSSYHQVKHIPTIQQPVQVKSLPNKHSISNPRTIRSSEPKSFDSQSFPSQVFAKQTFHWRWRWLTSTSHPVTITTRRHHQLDASRLVDHQGSSDQMCSVQHYVTLFVHIHNH